MSARAGLRALALGLGAIFFAGCEIPTKQTRVESFSIEIVGERENLATGEIIEYAVIPRRNGEVVPAVNAAWTSADPAILEFVDPEAGRAIARALGRTTIEVTVSEPHLSGGRALRAAAEVSVTTELFYGAFSKTTVRLSDTVTVLAPEGQEFGDSVRVFVSGPDAPEAFVLSHALRVLSFAIPARTEAGPVTFTEIGPEWKTLPSRTQLSRAAGDDDVDALEPNDSAAAATTLDSLDFDLVLTLDDGPDVDWFTFTPSQNRQVSLTLDWKTESNLDLWVLNDKLEVVDSTAAGDARPEQVTRSFSAKAWFLKVTRRDTLALEPVAYRITGRTMK